MTKLLGLAIADEGSKETYFVERLGVQENPPELDDLGGVLSHIDAVLIAGGRNVDDHVPICVRLCRRRVRHDVLLVAGAASLLYGKRSETDEARKALLSTFEVRRESAEE